MHPVAPAIHLRNLSKSFGKKSALRDLSLEVQTGEIFGLLGPNGAGKSTAMGILLGHVHPNSGEAFVSGTSVQRKRGKALAKVGAIFESPRFYDYLSGWKNLEIFASYTSLVTREEIAATVELVGLSSRIHDRVKAYSQGMRQRLGFAQAILPMPDILILDEPTNGLDPEGIHEMRSLIKRLNQERGITAIFCSHLLSEVEHLCDRVAIINQGNILYSGRWQDIRPKGIRFRILADPWEKAIPLLGEATILQENHIELPPGTDIADLVTRLVSNGLKIRALEEEKQSLEQFYLGQIQKP